MSNDQDTTRRRFLSDISGLLVGYMVGDATNSDAVRPVAGSGGRVDNDQIKVIFMPGKIKEHWYYPTIEEFENEVGEPDVTPAIVETNEGRWVYDG